MAPKPRAAAKRKPAPKRVLFLCIGNSCRSQMAEALARHLAADVIEPSSAGISPLGRIAEPTRRALLEKGILIDGQYSKGLDQTSLVGAELVVNMTGMPGAGLLSSFGPKVVDWDVDDPYGEDMEIYRRIRDDIEEKVLELAGSLRAKPASLASQR